jgi:hypothetical protein
LKEREKWVMVLVGCVANRYRIKILLRLFVYKEKYVDLVAKIYSSRYRNLDYLKSRSK